jgi:hypothetical protein
MDRRRSSHIVSEIYEATIDASHWDYVVTMIAKLTRSNAACLYYINKDNVLALAINAIPWMVCFVTTMTPRQENPNVSSFTRAATE